VCSNRHNWEKANLCSQGEYFAQRDQAAIERIQHPYGGFFKSAIKYWTANGCEEGKPVVLLDPAPRTTTEIFSADAISTLRERFHVIERGSVAPEHFIHNT